MYFAIYQAIAKDERRPGLYREYAPDFFDLIIVDECHRGSASDESNWREILEYFQPAYPARHDRHAAARGQPRHLPVFRQSPSTPTACGRASRTASSPPIASIASSRPGRRRLAPSKGELDRYGREIPDELYGTKDFERVVAPQARTQAIARHLTDYLQQDRPLRQDDRLLRGPGTRRGDADRR